MNTPTQPELVARSLKRLVDHIQPVDAINRFQSDNPNLIGSVVMTSMGTRRSAIVTPAYPGIQSEYKLLARLEAAATYQRPFIEGGLRLARNSNVASVILRYCGTPQIGSESDVTETSALFHVGHAKDDIATFEDAVNAIASGVGDAMPGSRSGYVMTRGIIHPDGKWQINVPEDPLVTAEVIDNAIVNKIFFAEL